jgi:RNA polymerase sigma factor FliA
MESMSSNTSVSTRTKGRTKGQRRAGADRYTELWTQHVAQRNVATRNALIEAYLPIVQRQARKVAAALSYAVTAQELESAGTLGLIDSIENFDPDQGFKFVTFCTPRVRGAMIDELRSWDWTPRATRAKLNKMERAVSKVQARVGRTPDESELARELGTTQDEVRKLVFAKNRSMLSLDRTWNDSHGAEGDPPAAILEDRRETDPAQHLQKKEITEVVRSMLSETERLVVTLYYYEQLNLREIGHVLRLTESRICQIHSKVVQRLKKKLA